MYHEPLSIQVPHGPNKQDEVEIIRIVQKKKKVLPPPPKIKVLDEPDVIYDETNFTDDMMLDEGLVPDTLAIDTNSIYVSVGESVIERKEPIPIVRPSDEDDSIHDAYQVEKLPFMGDCYGLEKEEMQNCAYAFFKAFMAEHMKYPSLARENQIEGTVHVQFVIGKTEAIENVEILREVSGGCSEEVLRVIRLTPNWSPGIQGGRPVKVKFTAPVSFQLN